MKPIIGVTSGYSLDENKYSQTARSRDLNAILNSGGIPMILPVTNDKDIVDEILQRIDGIVFTGGGDISPLTYGCDPIRELKEVSTGRDEFELLLYKRAELLDMPMLGICRGAQLMNVGDGGTLYQDIYVERDKTNEHSPKMNEFVHRFHSVEIIADTMLSSIFETKKLETNTSHHQAIKTVGKSYIVSAKASDGIVEAIESKKHSFAIGVQWHPEGMYELYPEFSKIYNFFIDEARNFSKKRN